jgi:acetyl-CoA acetyltransferase
MGALTDKYCIVGVGQTPFMKASNRSPLSLACEAVSNALDDAGLQPRDIDGLTSFHVGDSTDILHVATALGIRMNYGADLFGGGSSAEAMVAHAIGLIEAGQCKTVVGFRSLNGRSGMRMGGKAPTGPVPPMPAAGDWQFMMPWGFSSPAQWFAQSAMRYLKEFGASTRSFAEIAVAFRNHAGLNPKAMLRTPLTIEDHQRSRWVVKPLRLLDCCLETDTAAAFVVTSRERAYDLRQPPVFVTAGTTKTFTESPAWNFSRPRLYVQAGYHARQRLWGMAGIGPRDLDFISMYDAFTYTVIIMLEAYGFCEIGEGHEFVRNGRLRIDHELPCNTGGGHLSEGYAHGVALIVEDVRQLRHRADDSCPGWAAGLHSYDRAGGCRQVRRARFAGCFGWGTESFGSSLILRSNSA